MARRSANTIELRPSQLLSPYGPGAVVVDSAGVSWIIQGLDHWYCSQDLNCAEPSIVKEFELYEPRLASLLGVKALRRPPEFIEPGNSAQGTIGTERVVPHYSFPNTWTCPDDFCGKIRIQKIQQVSSRPICNGGDKRPHIEREMRQVTFAVMCESGHLGEFPLNEWVHRARTVECGPMNLARMRPDKSGWAGLRFICRNCNKVRGLDGIQRHNALEDHAFGGKLKYQCRGEQPWFSYAGSGDASCKKSPITTYLGASNVYFADTFSALTIPEQMSGEEIKIKLEQLPLDLLELITVLNGHPNALEKLKQLAADKVARGRLEMKFVLEAQDPELHNALELLFRFDTATTGFSSISDIRVREFRALAGDPPSALRPRDLPILGAAKAVSLNSISGATGFGWIEETRVLVGFTRAKPASVLSGPGSNGRANLAKRQPLEWLPARKTYGDGIFVKFDNESMQEWMGSVSIRYDGLESAIKLPPWSGGRYQQSCESAGVAAYVAMHSFSHALMGQIALWAGYNVASLKERIYSSTEGFGVLVFSNDGDADGSLGGLLAIGEGGKLGTIIESAIERIKWCGNDPVCNERASLEESHASLNLAACHSCLFLPEVSCEMSNRLLDRGSLFVEENNAAQRIRGIFG
jgi:hypothetical protein